MWNVLGDIPFTLHDSKGEELVINKQEDDPICRFRDNIALCGGKATWVVSMPGKHEMYVCDIHVKRYQQDKSDTGELREGRERDDGRYIIKPLIKSIESLLWRKI